MQITPPIPFTLLSNRDTASEDARSGGSPRLSLSRTTLEIITRINDSPFPVADTPPIKLSAIAPQPINGESPTLPGIRFGMPPVDVAAAIFPL